MNNKKPNWKLYFSIEYLLKAFLIVLAPYAIIRELLKVLGLYNPIIAGILPILLVYVIGFIRQKIKSSGKEIWVYILITLFCFPAGLYYIWKYSKWTRSIKIFTTISVIVPFSLWLILSSG